MQGEVEKRKKSDDNDYSDDKYAGSIYMMTTTCKGEAGDGEGKADLRPQVSRSNVLLP